MITLCRSYFFIFLYISFNLFFLGVYFLSIDYRSYSEYNLGTFNGVSIIYVILVDWISVLFIRFVFFISAAVIKYREEYIGEDFNLDRFVLLVVIFVFSIALIVIRPNLVSILLGWDGLGLVSYLLVIYYQNPKSFNAGILTALINRIGDVALLISIAWLFRGGSWNYILYTNSWKISLVISLVAICLTVAAFTKRAQIPFSSWLPAAIAAPTPVSALVHSSTLVTAGVYLLIRFREGFPASLINTLLLISLLTIFISGLAANFEFDLKKIIALSTLRQLGIIVRILAIGRRDLAFFHLLIHALFKALLFICAGMIIHRLRNCQDIRCMGRLVRRMPLTCTYINICNLSLCGLPFLSGFYSKDLVAEVISISYFNVFVYVVFFVSVGLTVRYRFRLTYYRLRGGFNFSSFNISKERRSRILKSMGLLIFLVIFIGRILIWLLFPTPSFIYLPKRIKVITLIIIILGIWIGYSIAKFSINYKNQSIKFYKFSLFNVSMWNLPSLSTFGVSRWFLKLGKKYTKLFDQGWLEYYGRQNFYKKFRFIAKILQFFSKNHFKIFLLLIFIWDRKSVV